jgi:hypothetical protein
MTPGMTKGMHDKGHRQNQFLFCGWLLKFSVPHSLFCADSWNRPGDTMSLLFVSADVTAKGMTWKPCPLETGNGALPLARLEAGPISKFKSAL